MAFRYSGINWEGRRWQCVGAIITLGEQVEEVRPSATPHDGTVASRAHDASSPTSDHRPDAAGNVRAIDFGGAATWLDEVAENLRVSQDIRIKYVIHGGRMFSSYAKPGYPPFTWRPYGGSNPHTYHIHVSVVDGPLGDNSMPFDIEGDDVAQFDEVTAQRLQQIADADRTDLTGEGQVLHGSWVAASEAGILSPQSDPTDLVSKQEFAAFALRIINAVEADSPDAVRAELQALKETLRSV